MQMSNFDLFEIDLFFESQYCLFRNWGHPPNKLDCREFYLTINSSHRKLTQQTQQLILVIKKNPSSFNINIIYFKVNIGLH